jgi:hypothetical protein
MSSEMRKLMEAVIGMTSAGDTTPDAVPVKEEPEHADDVIRLSMLQEEMLDNLREFNDIVVKIAGYDSSVHERFKRHVFANIMAAIDNSTYGSRGHDMNDIITDIQERIDTDSIDAPDVDMDQLERDVEQSFRQEESYLLDDYSDPDSLMQMLKAEGHEMVAAGRDAKIVAAILGKKAGLDATNTEILYHELLDKEYDRFRESVTAELDEIEKKLAVFESKILLAEDHQQPLPGAISAKLQQAQKRYDAARSGLSIAHRLPDGEEKAMHMKRIFGNMNRLRAEVKRVEKELAQAEQDLSRMVGKL